MNRGVCSYNLFIVYVNLLYASLLSARQVRYPRTMTVELSLSTVVAVDSKV